MLNEAKCSLCLSENTYFDEKLKVEEKNFNLCKKMLELLKDLKGLDKLDQILLLG
jgi:hypothetical protein